MFKNKTVRKNDDDLFSIVNLNILSSIIKETPVYNASCDNIPGLAFPITTTSQDDIINKAAHAAGMASKGHMFELNPNETLH